MSTSVNKSKRMLALALAVLLLLAALCVPAMAYDGETGTETQTEALSPVINWGQSGSLTIQPKYGDTVVSGCTFSLYLVAEFDQNSAEVKYNLVTPFSGALNADSTSLDINAAVNAGSLESAAKTLSGLTTGATAKTIASDTDTASGLPLGLYLVVQNSAPGRYTAAAPFLVSLPMNSSETTGWEYAVTAHPKLGYQPGGDSSSASVSVTKVWEDAGYESSRPASVKIGLYENGSETAKDTVTLNAANNWKYTWSNLSKSSSWTVGEIDVPENYESFVDGSNNVYTVTNTRTGTPLSGTLTVSKVWNDKKNAAGKRPDAVSVTLYGDGKAVETVKLSGENDWNHVWIGLSASAKWTVGENNVPAGYTSSVKVDGSYFTVTNSYGSGTPGTSTDDTAEIPDGSVPKGEAPYTGMLQWPIPVLLCAGVIFLLIGAAGGRKKKHEKT